jgi:hypothetical protein
MSGIQDAHCVEIKASCYQTTKAMRTKITIGILLLILFVPSLLKAQGEIDEQETIYYNDEKTWSGNLGTAGWGLTYRQARRVDASLKNIWEIDMVGLKHEKANSEQSRYVSGLVFTYGKNNSIVNFRFSLGRSKELFRKIDMGGVSVRWYYLAGPSLVWQKPCYYRYYNTQTGLDYPDRFYTESQRPYDFIVGKESYFKGFSESTFVAGGHLNTGLSFDYSTRSNYVLAFEVGAVADVFYKRLDIMSQTTNPFYVVQVYGAIRFGKIVDRMKVRLKKNEERNGKTSKRQLIYHY